jgi:hypothetical protein
MRRITARIEVTPEVVDEVMHVCGRVNMHRVELVSRLIDWVAAQSPPIQAVIGLNVRSLTPAELVSALLKENRKHKHWKWGLGR